jgi:hypothetical protein
MADSKISDLTEGGVAQAADALPAARAGANVKLAANAAGAVTIGNNKVSTAKLTTTGVSAGTYGNATAVAQVVLGADGRVTSASNVAISVGSTVDIEDEGAAEGAADTIDFVGAGVSVGFAAGKATVTIPGGSGSGISIGIALALPAAFA